jgi:hypothetical protein
MNHLLGADWKISMLGAMASLTIVASSSAAQLTGVNEEPVARVENRGPGSLNSGRGSFNSGAGSTNSESGGGDHRARRGGDHVVVTQLGDGRQEDHREDGRVDRRSNAGGELRGLDRADHVAGEHGRRGRDNARMAQIDRPNRLERMERPHRPERPERPPRPERPERQERAGRH